ncbi:tetratricopeptide repeat protein [Alteribacillus bidgolensis]|uniref:Tetratricopeptide repeat-containing protein n=1 Tax=Alteribacillus bidgolensis TaxID=930129 RepID=A0A1G8C6N7_9BACI|nr:tetratricopeptide repeat protein [Alteribacillus bidgolensis]SDH41181.1 Tetratricopeptide repeat-containing protein [Alteribacillus bidgolensis]
MQKSLEEIIQVIQEGDIEKGLKSLEQYERKADHQEKYDLVQLYEELGRLDKAKPLIEELINYYPEEGELLTMAAEIAIDMDEEDEAIEWLLEVDEEDEAFLRAQMLLADLYQLQGLDEVAEKKLKDALQKAPDEPVLLAGLGDYYLDRGDFAKSIPYLKQAERMGFEFPEGGLDLRLAEAYSATGEFETALPYYQKGLNEKADPHAMFGYGYTALQIEDYDLAAKEFNKLKEADPDFVTLYPYLIRAYEGLEKYELALKTAEQGLSVDEYNDTLFTEAGKLQLSLGNEKVAEERFREALSINPGNQEAATSVLALWLEQEDFEAIEDLVTYLKDIGEEDASFDWYHGKALWEKEDFQNAFQAYEKASASFMDNEEFLEDYGKLLLEMGHRDQALKIFKKAFLLDSSNESLQLLISELEDNFL